MLSTGPEREGVKPATIPLMTVDLPKFVPLEYVMDELSISKSQAYALVRSGDLRAIQVGGRGQWRVDLSELDAYIERAYAVAAAEVNDCAASRDLEREA